MRHFGWLLLALGFALITASPVAAQGKNPIVVMETSMGTIKIELFADKAPITVENFLLYVKDRHYDSTIFHRIIKDFVIQGGGHTAEMKLKMERDPIKNEAANGLSNVRGTIAMARTVRPDSGTGQFFINVVNNTQLDRAKSPDGHGYCVFGQVIEGMGVVDRIRAVKTGAGDVPEEVVLIKSVRLIRR